MKKFLCIEMTKRRTFLKSQCIKELHRKLLPLVQSGIWPLQSTNLLKTNSYYYQYHFSMA